MPRLLRLLCFTLTLLLALPAMQARACGPEMGHGVAQMHAAAREKDGHGTHHMPRPAEAPHDCIGCIAPIDLGSYRPIERPAFGVDRAGRAAPALLRASPGSPPEPPPPRLTV